MSELFEFIIIEYSFREINFRGIQLLGVSQELCDEEARLAKCTTL